MFHSIISDYDVFFANPGFDPDFSGLPENRQGYFRASADRKEQYGSDGFFSTNPGDYLKKII